MMFQCVKVSPELLARIDDLIETSALHFNRSSLMRAVLYKAVEIYEAEGNIKYITKYKPKREG